MYPNVSTIISRVSRLVYEGIGRINLQRPPMRKGMKYHVLNLTSWNVCMAVDTPKTTVKMIVAAMEGV